MPEPFSTYIGLRHCVSAGLAGALMLVGACASTPIAPPTGLDAARTAITNAEKADAGRFAAAELGEAREKLALADSSMQGKNPTEEARLVASQRADEARVSAELASARTEAAKAVAINKELSQGADALNEEMQRAGDKR